MEIKITNLTKNNPTTTQLGYILADVLNTVLEEVNDEMTVEIIETDEVEKTIKFIISKKEEES